MVHLKTKVAEYAIITDKERILIVQWKAAHDYKWHFPGGRLEEGEKEIEGLKREVKEELGLEIEHIKPAYAKYIGDDYCKKGRDEPRYALFYTAKLKGEGNIELNTEELESYRWITENEIDKIDFWLPFYKEMLKKIIV